LKKNRPLEFSIGGGDTGATDITEVVVLAERVLVIKFLKLSYYCRKQIIIYKPNDEIIILLN